MHRRRPPNKSVPKISTMPRQQSEAAQYLDMYKLMVEKKRIQQELDYLEQRRQQLQTRLTTIHHQVGQLEGEAQHIAHSQPTSHIYPPTRPAEAEADDDDFGMVLLEY